MNRLIEFPDFGFFTGSRSKYSTFFGRIILETNKAYKVELLYEFQEEESIKFTQPIWLPKSLTSIENCIFPNQEGVVKIRAISLMVKSDVFGKEYAAQIPNSLSGSKIFISCVSR